ncbi:hypothetical protein BT96DRAFT_152524 [Gymnopus androsaceus JB14]|uniref:Uncharacterized protein n=1 Tax=Gymnopus androsaceus JB14 TaxID=1447944 RepID=A0A6A4IDC6_9AGAR|nr:hypothetical protein BT96DRAFT_152524 [Gymnopus androsaceus JB14]
MYVPPFVYVFVERIISIYPPPSLCMYVSSYRSVSSSPHSRDIYTIYYIPIPLLPQNPMPPPATSYYTIYYLPCLHPFTPPKSPFIFHFRCFAIIFISFSLHSISFQFYFSLYMAFELSLLIFRTSHSWRFFHSFCHSLLSPTSLGLIPSTY